jgi:hypothetical protein
LRLRREEETALRLQAQPASRRSAQTSTPPPVRRRAMFAMLTGALTRNGRAAPVAAPASAPADGGGAAVADACYWQFPPRDVLSSILALLAGDTVALCTAVCVCRGWHGAVTTTPELWRELRVTDYRVLDRIDDAAVARRAGRAQGGLTLVQLDGATRISDACLACFAPHAAPLLATLSLVGCPRVTALAVLKQRRELPRDVPRLSFLALARTAPLSGSVADDETLLDSLKKLVVADNDDEEDETTEQEQEAGGMLDVVAVCAHTEEDGPRCGLLLDSENVADCDFCHRSFCKVLIDTWCTDTAHPAHGHICVDCKLCACAGCLPDALESEDGDPDVGHVCSRCHGMLCGSCATARQDAGSITQAQCGVCEKRFCAGEDECLFRPEGYDGVLPSCEVWLCSRADPSQCPPDGCLGFVCINCYQTLHHGVEENLIHCATCETAFCRLCADGGFIKRTGRFVTTGPSVTEAYCRSCLKRRRERRAAR